MEAESERGRNRDRESGWEEVERVGERIDKAYRISPLLLLEKLPAYI